MPASRRLRPTLHGYRNGNFWFLRARWRSAATEISPCPANGTGPWPGMGQRRRLRAMHRPCLSVRLSGAGYDSAYEKRGASGRTRRETRTVSFLTPVWNYVDAHVLSSLSFAGLAAGLAWCTGGIESFTAIWLVVVPLEASLSASRRVVLLAAIFALAAAGILFALNALGLQPPATVNVHGTLAALAVVSAVLYAAGLALGAEQLTRTSAGLLNAEEERYRLLARNMTDVITRHGKNGAVLFVSPAAEPLFGVRAGELAGHGLFDRVHVADRPAYLTALADAGRSARPARSNSASAATAMRIRTAGISPGSKCVAG